MIKTNSLPTATLSFPLLKIYLIDLLAITFIYFLPAISHLTSLPLYFIEPLRLAVLFCLVHTNRKNTFLIAMTVPLFSLIVSSHPSLFKSFLITAELLINLFLFLYLIQKISKFTAMFLSILWSKLLYYSAKYLFIQFNLIDGGLLSTPLIIQLVLAVALSLYVAVWFEKTAESRA